jgi:SAM-dependent methyltransferase
VKLVSHPIDVVASATTLHWLNPKQVARFYNQLGQILRPGGIFLNADHVSSNCASIQKSWEQNREHMCKKQADSNADDWEGFWDAYGQALKIDIKEFHKKLMGPWEGSEEGLPLEWHFEKLKAGGFEAVDCFWRCDCDAIYGGVRKQI